MRGLPHSPIVWKLRFMSAAEMNLTTSCVWSQTPSLVTSNIFESKKPMEHISETLRFPNSAHPAPYMMEPISRKCVPQRYSRSAIETLRLSFVVREW